jgi:tRNA threonylcarbamoyladenosine biosynthesis protein TsaE
MEFYAEKESDLIQISTDFLNAFKEESVFAFYAEMGAGKTTFIRYLAKAMGIEDEVSSPTYGFVNEYSSPFFGTVYHFDLYRINDEAEAYDIGMEEYLYDESKVFIEWAENIDNLLPEPCVRITITKDTNGGRRIEAKL